MKIENLRLGYPGKMLCRDLSLEIGAGQFWGILGANGSGKTTLLQTLAGLSEPQQGRISLAGKPLADYSQRELARSVGILLQQEDRGFWGSVRDYVLLGRYPHTRSLFGFSAEDLAAAEHGLDLMDLAALAARPLVTLSGGERQRARIALLLAQEPHIYLLDEPLQHLDLRHQLQTLSCLRRLVEEQGKAALMVLHEPFWASRYCSHALLIYAGGEIVSGAASDVLDLAHLEPLYGCRLEALGSGRDRHFLPRPDEGGAAASV